jgi:hypothetical protein
MVGQGLAAYLVMTYEEQRRIYLDYLKLKIWEEDWHGVADAAMDLREVEAQHGFLRIKAPEAGASPKVGICPAGSQGEQSAALDQADQRDPHRAAEREE